MTALNIHLNELLAVLRASAGLDPAGCLPVRLRDGIVERLAWTDPLLADRVRRLDDWHTEALAQLVVDAHELADALEGRTGPPGDDAAETWVG